nr:hypothetical protein CcurKRNrm1_p055 [Cryptomonas curvata]
MLNLKKLMSKKWKIIRNFKRIFNKYNLTGKKTLPLDRDFLFFKKNYDFFFQHKNSRFMVGFLLLLLSSVRFFRIKYNLFLSLNKIKYWILFKKNAKSILDYYKTKIFPSFSRDFRPEKNFFNNQKQNFLEKFLLFIEIYSLLKNYLKKVNLLKIDFYFINLLKLEKFLIIKIYLKGKKNRKKSLSLFFLQSFKKSKDFLTLYCFLYTIELQMFCILTIIKLNLLIIIKFLYFLVSLSIKFQFNINKITSRKKYHSIKILLISRIFFGNKIIFYDEKYSLYNSFFLVDLSFF